MTVGKHAHPLKVARELDDCSSRLDRQAANAIRDLHTQRNNMLFLLKRYREETPLGHQPHMIAHLVDEAIEKATKE